MDNQIPNLLEERSERSRYVWISIIGLLLLLIVLALIIRGCKDEQKSSSETTASEQQSESGQEGQGSGENGDDSNSPENSGDGAANGNDSPVTTIQSVFGQGKDASASSESSVIATAEEAAESARSRMANAQRMAKKGDASDAFLELSTAWSELAPFCEEDSACAALSSKCEAEMKPLVGSLNGEAASDIQNDKMLFIE